MQSLSQFLSPHRVLVFSLVLLAGIPVGACTTAEDDDGPCAAACEGDADCRAIRGQRFDTANGCFESERTVVACERPQPVPEAIYYGTDDDGDCYAFAGTVPSSWTTSEENCGNDEDRACGEDQGEGSDAGEE